MIGIHAGQGGPDEFGTRFAACFMHALDDAQLPDDPKFRDIMRRFIEAAAGEVNSYSPAGTRAGSADAALDLGRTAADVTPPPGRPLPRQMARIKMVDEADAAGPLVELYAAAKSRSVAKVVPDILRTMSLRPDFLTAIDSASRLHFSDGALTRAQHEMIASYVSALNRCRY